MIHETYVVKKDDYENAGSISSSIKQMLAHFGIQHDILRRIAVACYEAEINMIIHSDGGKIDLTIDDEGNITISFVDTGPGIEDIDKAMTPGFSTANDKARELGFGAGMGLFNIKRVSDTFDLQSSPNGTDLTIGFKDKS